MIKIVPVSVLAAILAVGLSTGFAQAEERDRDRDRSRVRQVCTYETRCHREDGRRQCHREKVCKMVRDNRR